MKALIVSDVHSNIEAFTSVIADANVRGGFDEIWSLGDLIGYGPNPVECIDLLSEHKHRAVAGNHDLASIGKISLDMFNPYARAANEWTTEQLSQDHIDFIAAQKTRLEYDEFTLVHGSPRDPVWEYVMTVHAAVASFMHYETYWCLVGHTHVPFLCHETEKGATFVEFPLEEQVALTESRVIINPGSVGQPRDQDPRASYAVYDSDSTSVTHYRTQYDIPKTQAKMHDCSLPEFLITRLENGQ